MSTFIKITPFNGGNTDFSESVEEYLDDIETAALSWDLTITPGIMDATNKLKIRLFCQNLERNGDAWYWWCYVLPEKDKKNYSKIAEEFRNRYGVKTSQASSLFAVQNEMLSLAQGDTEHIRDYVHRVEKLSRKIPKDMDSLFAIAFIKGMKDQERRQRVTFDLKGSPNFSFLKALEVVKFAFQEIGEPDPFKPNQKSYEPELQATNLYSAPSLPPVRSVVKAEVPHTHTSGTIGLSATMTQDQFNTYMSPYEASLGRRPQSPYGQPGGGTNLRRGNPRVTCFNCGIRGHYSDMCTNPPVSSFEQQQIRERIRREREVPDSNYRIPDRPLDPPLSGANAIDINPRTVVQRPSNISEVRALPTTSSPVTCVRSCSVNRKELGNACVILARIPAIRTIFENALAEKRARVEEEDVEINGSRM
ncbi:hypothetical protein HOY82DRAFT_610018 [Tuber indicum]|nr:hypothetical protein HOY82DRAFT_610018 [Tuber indicum]